MTRQSLVASFLSVILCATVLDAASLPVHAEAITLEGKNFASLQAFLVGSWTWIRREPAQVVHMRFGNDGSFFFNNATIKLMHYGNYKTTEKGIELTILRSCDPNGCENRTTPVVHNYSLRPETPNRFMAGSEEWNRDP